MQLTVLLDAVSPIPSHAIAAFAALGIGFIQFIRPKGTDSHRWIGRAWVLLMAYVAVSSFFINEFRMVGPFSLIHVLSLVTIGTLVWAVIAARRGQIHIHKRLMKYLFWLALVVTGLFTLLPGRTMHQVIFS